MTTSHMKHSLLSAAILLTVATGSVVREAVSTTEIADDSCTVYGISRPDRFQLVSRDDSKSRGCTAEAIALDTAQCPSTIILKTSTIQRYKEKCTALFQVPGDVKCGSMLFRDFKAGEVDETKLDPKPAHEVRLSHMIGKVEFSYSDGTDGSNPSTCKQLNGFSTTIVALTGEKVLKEVAQKSESEKHGITTDEKSMMRGRHFLSFDVIGCDGKPKNCMYVGFNGKGIHEEKCPVNDELCNHLVSDPVRVVSAAREIAKNLICEDEGKSADECKMLKSENNFFDPILPRAHNSATGNSETLSANQTGESMSTPDKGFTTSGNCFPADALVSLEDGSTKRMDELEIGDSVVVGVGGERSEIFMFTHKLPKARARFVHVHVQGVEAPLRLSSGHYVYVNSKLVAASTIHVGDLVTLADGKTAAVTMVSRDVGGIGLYNPQTLHGDIVVDGVLCSTYTTAASAQVAHAALAPLRALYRSIGWTTSLLDNGADGVAQTLGKFATTTIA